MKTQLIHLESHDDLISIRDKMAWAKTPRILLAWPRTGRVDVRPLDLVLLRRHAESLGAELGLVTRDSEIRAAARQINLPAFKTASEAQRKTWPERNSAHPVRRFPKINLRSLRAALPAPELFDFSTQPDVRVAVFAIGVLAVMIVALFFVPSAEIRINPPTQPQSVTIAVSAEADVSQINLSGVIPAREMSLTLDGSDSMRASGYTTISDENAQGTVRFTNLTSATVKIPAKTVLLTRSNPPVRFETVKEAKVSTGNSQAVNVSVRALTPGLAGNVPANTIVAFEGPLGLSLAVTNPMPISGGKDRTIISPTDADRQSLRKRLLAKLDGQAKNQLQAQLKDGDVFFPSTFAFSKVLDENYSLGPNQPGQELSLTMHAQFRAFYASADDLNQLARIILDASLPAGYEPAGDTLTVKPVSALFGGTQGVTRWQIRAERTLRARIDPVQVIYLARGKTAWRAGSLLQQTFGLESAPQINIQPFFWPWLPSLPFRITVAG